MTPAAGATRAWEVGMAGRSTIGTVLPSIGASRWSRSTWVHHDGLSALGDDAHPQAFGRSVLGPSDGSRRRAAGSAKPGGLSTPLLSWQLRYNLGWLSDRSSWVDLPRLHSARPGGVGLMPVQREVNSLPRPSARRPNAAWAALPA